MWREVFEDILVGLGVPYPPVDAFATEANHLCPVWWVPGGEHEDAFAQSWKGQFLWMNPPIPCWIRLCINVGWCKCNFGGAQLATSVVVETFASYGDHVVVFPIGSLNYRVALVVPVVGERGHILSQVPPW